jgi:phospholipase C
MTVKKSAPLFAAMLGLTAALGLLAPNSIGAQPGDRDDHQHHERRKGLDKITHIVFIVKENRTFDNYFGTFPGADRATFGQISTGAVIPLRHAPDMTPRDIDHSYQAAVEAIEGGAMDRFDLIKGGNVNGDYLSYSQYYESDIPNYFTYARNFVLADAFFSSLEGPSFPNHLYTVGAHSNRAINNPSTSPGNPAR